MWEPREASLALQMFATGGRGDPASEQRCRPGVSQVSTGSLSLFISITANSSHTRTVFPKARDQRMR